ncbi:acyltransferase [Lachnospiraceae bacterium OttesenSCG-928-D06]|nr:acyltransferase [Lachnospiraceae bacterium OttesenSCG-928-D06]
MRKVYLDNIRFIVVGIVVIYHIIYSFNNVQVISNLNVQGIPQMDAFLYFVYPWFMACLFLIGGIGARYSLEKRGGKQFIKERAKRLLLPAIAGIFITGWILGYVTTMYNGMFVGEMANLPGIIRYLIRCMIGIGPLWFAHELFLASVVLLIVRTVDKKDKLWELGGKLNIVGILLLVLPVWGSSFLFNTPLIEVYRNGIYVFLFLLGYYIFSHESVINCLVTYKLPLLLAGILLGILYTVYYYGQNYTTASCLQSPFTNIYLWIMILAILGCGKAWLDKTNKFTQYMSSRSFAIYVLHMPLIVYSAYLLDTYTELSMIWIYIILFLLCVTVLPLIIEIIKKIPGLRFLLLGENGKS